MPSARTLVLFTKPPRPGRVKTRLIGEERGALTPEEAAALHWAFVLDQLGRLEGRDFDLRVAWDLEEGETPPEVGTPGFRQVGEDLGARLWDGLSRAAGLVGGVTEPSSAAVAAVGGLVAAVGSDHPHLTLEDVELAFERLDRGAELVLGPAADGGYYLIALRAERLDRRLFEGIPWSTAAVLDETLARAREVGLETELLAEGHDVDTPADLGRLAARISHEPHDCPRTRSLLASWGLLP